MRCAAASGMARLCDSYGMTFQDGTRSYAPNITVKGSKNIDK